jgi:hypothetical protein
MSDSNQRGTNIEGGGDVNIGGDVVGRDKVSNSTNTTTISEGGPVARYSVLGVVGIAALAILMFTFIILRNGGTAALTATPTATAPMLTPTSTPTISTAAKLATPTETSTLTPIPTETATPTSTPTELPPPTSTGTPIPTETLQPAITVSPVSSVPVYDNFADGCLDADKWALVQEPPAPETPTPEPVLSSANCLDVQHELFTEGRDGRLSVLLTFEGGHTHQLLQKSNACYDQAEVVLALNNVSVLGNDPRTSFINVGLSLDRQYEDGVLDVRLEGSNATGKLASQAILRWTTARGPFNIAVQDYSFDQPVTVAFRIEEVGVPQGNATQGATNKILTVYLGNKPFGLPFSMLLACGLTIGYHADDQTSLKGYFEEVRLQPAP